MEDDDAESFSDNMEHKFDPKGDENMKSSMTAQSQVVQKSKKGLIAVKEKKSHPEHELWISACLKIMSFVEKPLHFTKIKKIILEKGLLPPGMKTSFESALSKEASIPVGGRVKEVLGQPGYFAQRISIRSKTKMLSGTAEVNGSTSRDRVKYKRLRRMLKNVIFTNAAICDEVIRVEERIHKTKDERKYLLKKLFQYQTVSEVVNQVVAKQNIAAMTTQLPPSLPGIHPNLQRSIAIAEMKKLNKAGAKKKAGASGAKKKIGDSKTFSKKSSKKIIQPLPLDNTGRPVFPIEIGSLTVHSIGEILPNRPGFNTASCIYPVGYCSTRIYASMVTPEQKCLYTCKITDTGQGPKFEICPEDLPGRILTGSHPNECHHKLIQSINEVKGYRVIESRGCGANFFGLSHPSIQNLIQSCPGSKKCTGYKWIKFEISKSEVEDEFCKHDVAISFEALVNSPAFLKGVQPEENNTQVVPSGDSSGSLRNLLTSSLK